MCPCADGVVAARARLGWTGTSMTFNFEDELVLSSARPYMDLNGFCSNAPNFRCVNLHQGPLGSS